MGVERDQRVRARLRYVALQRLEIGEVGLAELHDVRGAEAAQRRIPKQLMQVQDVVGAVKEQGVCHADVDRVMAADDRHMRGRMRRYRLVRAVTTSTAPPTPLPPIASVSVPVSVTVKPPPVTSASAWDN